MSERRIQISIDLVTRTVHVHDGLTPLRARALNLTAVTQALDDAGIDHFAVRGTQDCGSVVAVREDQRARVLAALQQLGGESAAYVTTVLPKPSARDLPGPAGAADTWRTTGQAKVLRMSWYRTDPARAVIYDAEYGCDVEFWDGGADGTLTAPRFNRVTRSVAADAPPVYAPAGHFTRLGDRPDPQPEVRTHPEMTVVLPDDIGFPIDVVYVWDETRDGDDLRYSLRSLHANAPWVRTVHVVTDDPAPDWLDTTRAGLRMVSHKEIFSDPGVLPVAGPSAVESRMHHIDGLAEHFLYVADGMFFGRPVAPQAFFVGNGLSRFFLSSAQVRSGRVDAARALLSDRFGVTATQGCQHVPYPLRRSVLSEIEDEFPQAEAVVSYLHHHYAYLTGRAVPGSVRYGYLELSVAELGTHLNRVLARRDWDTFCLGGSGSTEQERVYQRAAVRPFLLKYFPVAGPFERS